MSLRTGESAFVESPEPLTDSERRMLKRMFSDYFEVPTEWKNSLRRDLEADPPILGKYTLGLGGKPAAKIPLESLAASGMIGTSGVSISNQGVWLGNVPITGGSGYLNIYAEQLGFGANQDVIIGRQSPSILKVPALYVGTGAKVLVDTTGGGVLTFKTNILRFGFDSQDVTLNRYSSQTLEVAGQLIVGYDNGPGLTGLYVVENGTLILVRIGPGGSGPGGTGRALWVY